MVQLGVAPATIDCDGVWISCPPVSSGEGFVGGVQIAEAELHHANFGFAHGDSEVHAEAIENSAGTLGFFGGFTPSTTHA